MKIKQLSSESKFEFVNIKKECHFKINSSNSVLFLREKKRMNYKIKYYTSQVMVIKRNSLERL